MKRNEISLGIVVQARTGSTRMPNKVVLDFYNGQNILEIILGKFKDVYFYDFPKVLATSISNGDKVLENYSSSNCFQIFNGSERDVLDRFIRVGKKYQLTHILRVCADNPFLNLDSIKSLIDKLYEMKEDDRIVDYLSYKNIDNLPTIRTHLGLFAEIVSVQALEKVTSLTNEELYHEHVTNYIYERPNLFSVILLPAHKAVFKRNDIRLTIDDEDDFSNIRNLYSEVFGISENILNLVQVIDNSRQRDYKKIMIANINKYSK